MKLRKVSSSSTSCLLILLVTFSLLIYPSYLSRTLAQTTGLYKYEFLVDKDGLTNVRIKYLSEVESGSSWILIPKNLEWNILILKGKIDYWSINTSEEVTDISYYFYEAFVFSFSSSDSKFELIIEYNFTNAGMIIEPYGIFYSPQIGFEKGNNLEIEVKLPEGFTILQDQALALGKNVGYNPTNLISNESYFNDIPANENLMRVEIGFSTPDKIGDIIKIEKGIFVFETVKRYEGYARKIIELYYKTYEELVDFFNVTLENAQAHFFVPDFNSLVSVAGYVPFYSDTIGDININIVYMRYVEGYVEVTALHELIHHFMWKVGISPSYLLWFHEGMAEYLSIYQAKQIGYEAMEIIEEDMSANIMRLRQITNDNFNFIVSWTPSSQPENVGSYYLAAYYIVNHLAESFGGPTYYKTFFKLAQNNPPSDDSILTYYLGFAANQSVANIFWNWGFNLPDLYIYSFYIEGVKEILSESKINHQPWRSLAEFLYRLGISNAREKSVFKMQFYFIASILIAKLSPLLSILVVAAIIFIIFLTILIKKHVLSTT